MENFIFFAVIIILSVEVVGFFYAFTPLRNYKNGFAL